MVEVFRAMFANGKHDCNTCERQKIGIGKALVKVIFGHVPYLLLEDRL